MNLFRRAINFIYCFGDSREIDLSLFERWLISKFGILDILNFSCSKFRTPLFLSLLLLLCKKNVFDVFNMIEL